MAGHTQTIQLFECIKENLFQQVEEIATEAAPFHFVLASRRGCILNLKVEGNVRGSDQEMI